MTIRLGLIADIKAALSGALSPNLTAGSNGDDLYEAYIWTVVLDAARNKGATILFKDVFGNNPTSTFYFRTSPGEIWWNSKNYCHAEIQFPTCTPLEAHIGIYVEGRSKVRHECDVAILFKTEADICRSKNALPRASKVIMSVEAKYYVGSTLGLGLGRAFLGLCNEIQRLNRFFIATSPSKSIAKLLSKHTIGFDLGFTPTIPHNVDVMRGLFEKVFANFIAQESS
ncbi:hypothetical protein [Bradyrhizobium sp. S69]|uniref:hypothetical protein n=1 Tax=Bradyrhizobium sp. S69 TaxID=1641856 RepID=UPI00131BD853|nr:hypothetical protein [Bradyrhizobium sp. S69]